MAANNKFWSWIKLTPSFFNDHKIKLLRAMDNGDSYLIFYIYLLAESSKHNGALRYSDEIPYDEKALSVITNTNLDTVIAAIPKLQQLELLCVLDNKTYFMERLFEHVGQDNSTEAKNKRRVRYLSNAKSEKNVQVVDNFNVGNVSVPVVSDKCPIEVKSLRVKELKSNRIKDNTGKKTTSKKIVKKVYGEHKFVKLSDIEYSKLLELLGSVEVLNNWIEKVDIYCQCSKPKGYNDYYLTIRQWMARENKNSNPKQTKKIYEETDW